MELAPAPWWQTATVELFLLGPEHVGPAYVGWLNEPTINRFLESRFATHDEAGTRAFVTACRASANTLFLGIRAIALGGRHVGNIKLAQIDVRHGLGEIGILIGEKDAWGRGIATESIRALAQISDRQLALRKLTAGCYASNVGSMRAFERAGFEIEGTRRDHFVLDGRGEDLILMARWLS